MSRFVTLSGREADRLGKIEATAQENFKKGGGQGDWQNVAAGAGTKILKGEVLSEEEKLARSIAFLYLGQAARIHNELFGSDSGLD
jgi:hypothetical protein